MPTVSAEQSERERDATRAALGELVEQLAAHSTGWSVRDVERRDSLLICTLRSRDAESVRVRIYPPEYTSSFPARVTYQIGLGAELSSFDHSAELAATLRYRAERTA